ALIASQVYPPVHWSLNQAEWDLAAALSRRILSLPCDHRYGVADMRRIASVLTQHVLTII
ncbi:MAG: hypothetical protein AAF265_14685, partial [Pseudomonadota bacterium]